MSLPASYYLTRDPALLNLHLRAIYNALHDLPSVYWGKDRTLVTFTKQIDRAWTCCLVLKEREVVEGVKAEEEVVGFCRVISDGEG